MGCELIRIGGGGRVPQLCGWSLGLAACGGGASAPPPNVLLISLDSVRADVLTFRDAATAPHMTALAERGTVFTQAIAGSSWTLPGHAQLFTGQPPSLHRVEHDDVRIDPATPTLPELLRAGGWWTAGAWSGWYLAGDFGFDRGFQSYRNAMTGGEELEQRLDQMRAAGLAGASGALDDFFTERDQRAHRDVTSGRVVERLAEAIDAAPAERPLFLFAHFFDPHYDYVPPAPFDTEFDPDYAGTIDGSDYWMNPRVFDEGRRQVSERDLEHLRALYRGEVRSTDEHVGALLGHLERAGRLENTLIVIVSDHGEEFFEHDGRGHRQTLYDEVLRVPLLIVPPASMPAAPEAAAQVELSDILPTLLDFAGLEVPESVIGRSLRPAVEGERFESRPVLSSLLLVRTGPAGVSTQLIESWRTPEQKLLRTLRLQNGRSVGLSVSQCELARDPRERAYRPLSSPVASPQAWAALEARVRLLRERYDRLEHASDAARQTTLSAHLADELGGLGYAEASDSGTLAPSQVLPWGLGVRPEASQQR